MQIFLGVCVSQAAENLFPNWNLNNVSQQTRQLTTNYSGTGSVVGGGSIYGNVENTSLTIDSLTVSSEDNPKTTYDNGSAFVAGGAVGNATAQYNTMEVINSTVQGRTVLGGLSSIDYIENRSGAGSANYNTVRITNSSIIPSSSFIPTGETSAIQSGGNVIGGFTPYHNGHADYNTVVIDNTNVSNSVYGAFVEPLLVPGIDEDENYNVIVPTPVTADYNTVQILNGSTVSGNVIGSQGASSSTGNTVIIDNSTVGSVLGVGYPAVMRYQQGTTSAAGNFTNNTVAILNGATVGNAFAVFGQYVDEDTGDTYGASVNASGNNLVLDNATVSNGWLYSVFMDLYKSKEGNVYNATVGSNSISLANMASAVAVREVAASLNLTGTSNNNNLFLNNLAAFTVNRQPVSLGVLDLDYLTAYNLIAVKNLTSTNLTPTVTSVNNFKPAYGFIYGGASLDYTEQENDYTWTPPTPGAAIPDQYAAAPAVNIIANTGSSGTSSDGNTVYIANSNVHANIAGGVAAQVQDIHYATWAYASGKYTKTEVVKVGDEVTTYTYDCGSSGTSCTLTDTSDPQTVSNFDSHVFSASNNQIILENSSIDGVVYGGYVVGADLKASNVQTNNNTVILRGSTTLADDAVLYGGSSSFGRGTNTLVFDRVAAANGGFVTYKSKNQFQNFNNVWQIKADLNTRINFDFNNVNALVTVDRGIGEGSAKIIKTQTAVDMSDVVQDGVVADLSDTSIELAQNRVGIYSYSLTPTKENATTVGWVLNSVKDHANAEVYGQVPLVGLALAVEGPDMLSRTFEEAYHNEEEQSTFLNGGYHHTRYITGSGFDLNAGLIQVGLWKKLSTQWLGGFFVKYVGGSYKTFPIKATGQASAYGGGLMSAYQYSDTGRVEASVEGGYMRLDFKTQELLSELQTKGAYYGAAFGIVEMPLPDWDLFGRFQFLHKNADSVTDNLDQDIKYNAIRSLSLQAGTSYRFNNVDWDGVVPLLGISGLYEFDGKSKLQVTGLDSQDASLKGASAKAEAGLFYQNEDTFLPVRSQLTVFGQAGKRRGFGAQANISFQF